METNLKFLVDTGSAINVMHNTEMQSLQPTVHIRIPRHNFASTVDGSAAQVFGEVQLKIIINEQTYVDQFSIMNCGQFSGILGQPFLNKYNAVIDAGQSRLLLEKRQSDEEPLTDDDDMHHHHAATADKRFTIQPMHETIAVAQTDFT